LSFLSAEKTQDKLFDDNCQTPDADIPGAWVIVPVSTSHWVRWRHLDLGRAYALQGDTVKARTAYQDFFTLWKDADPDIPILKEAKAEYAKLQ
jgi:hypothetical protein